MHQLILLCDLYRFFWYKHWTYLIPCFVILPLNPCQKFMLLFLSLKSYKIETVSSANSWITARGLSFLRSIPALHYFSHCELVLYLLKSTLEEDSGMWSLHNSFLVCRSKKRKGGFYFCRALSPMSPSLCWLSSGPGGLL